MAHGPRRVSWGLGQGQPGSRCVGRQCGQVPAARGDEEGHHQPRGQGACNLWMPHPRRGAEGGQGSLRVRQARLLMEGRAQEPKGGPAPPRPGCRGGGGGQEKCPVPGEDTKGRQGPGAGAGGRGPLVALPFLTGGRGGAGSPQEKVHTEGGLSKRCLSPASSRWLLLIITNLQ